MHINSDLSASPCTPNAPRQTAHVHIFIPLLNCVYPLCPSWPRSLHTDWAWTGQSEKQTRPEKKAERAGEVFARPGLKPRNNARRRLTTRSRRGAEGSTRSIASRLVGPDSLYSTWVNRWISSLRQVWAQTCSGEEPGLPLTMNKQTATLLYYVRTSLVDLVDLVDHRLSACWPAQSTSQ